MKLETYGDWFTGFGGMTLGAIDARLTVVFGAEYDPKIAEVYRLNIGDHIRVCNLLEVDVSEFPRVDVFHASPPCPNFSNAKTNGKETENDIALSAKVAEYIAYHLPDIFTLENVYQYRNSKSWQVIAKTLHDNGYLFNYWHVNMADYGVPQTRKRMIVIARRDGVMPTLPPATHAKGEYSSWLNATRHVIPSMQSSEFANWQLRRMPADVVSRVAVNDIGAAFLFPGQNASTSRLILSTSPAYTVTTGNVGRVFFDGQIFLVSPEFNLALQTFPRKYKLPEQKRLSFRGIGNAVPPLFASKLYTHLLQQYSG